MPMGILTSSYWHNYRRKDGQEFQIGLEIFWSPLCNQLHWLEPHTARFWCLLVSFLWNAFPPSFIFISHWPWALSAFVYLFLSISRPDQIQRNTNFGALTEFVWFSSTRRMNLHSVEVFSIFWLVAGVLGFRRQCVGKRPCHSKSSMSSRQERSGCRSQMLCRWRCWSIGWMSDSYFRYWDEVRLCEMRWGCSAGCSAGDLADLCVLRLSSALSLLHLSLRLISKADREITRYVMDLSLRLISKADIEITSPKNKSGWHLMAHSMHLIRYLLS